MLSSGHFLLLPKCALAFQQAANAFGFSGREFLSDHLQKLRRKSTSPFAFETYRSIHSQHLNGGKWFLKNGIVERSLPTG